MSQVVKEVKPLVILYSSKEKRYIVYNTNKEWKCGHTHIGTLKQAEYLCDCIRKSKVPHNVNKYFIISLLRLSHDKGYSDKLKTKLNSFNGSKGYRNTPSNIRK
jgi:hypothetical protein|nr:MAG TPA: hypothetical protein [Caudoviricetes sp.]